MRLEISQVSLKLPGTFKLQNVLWPKQRQNLKFSNKTEILLTSTGVLPSYKYIYPFPVDTSESDSDSAHTALAPPPTVPQDSSSTPQFSPPSVPSASLPGSPTMSETFDARLAHLEQASQTQTSQHPTQPPSSASSSTLPLITFLELHMLRCPHLASLTVNILMAESGGLVQSSMPAQFVSKTTSPRSYRLCCTYHQSLIDHKHLYGSSCFDTWEEFEKEFIREFMPEDEHTQASLTLEGASYFQGTTSVDEYVDNFHALITMAGLNIKPVLYSTNPTNPAIKA
ncbi:hypothetical protein D9758_010213 [Tetrapyrgos nigripes]|uniref:Retrotransposon gag domain-containing protein n=1 Tax=Tetrapyrgos nigripes TaxID=182062 RepID=A0A8H5D0A1_9AGAR|nr:hypothetical protein D9758_010213 [Tetrapyrgos nigripes]